MNHTIELISDAPSTVLIPTGLFVVGSILSRYIDSIDDPVVITIVGVIALIAVTASMTIFLGFMSEIISVITSSERSLTIDSYTNLVVSGLRLLVSVAPPTAVFILLYSRTISPATRQLGVSEILTVGINITVIYILYSVVFAIITLVAANNSIIAGYNPIRLLNLVANITYPFAMILLWWYWFRATLGFLAFFGLVVVSIGFIGLVAATGGGIVLGILLYLGLFSFIGAPLVLFFVLPFGFGTYYVLATHLGHTYVEINGIDGPASQLNSPSTSRS